MYALLKNYEELPFENVNDLYPVINTTSNEDDGKIVEYDNSNIIKNISYDQSEILYNIMNLYNNGEPFDCDMTASELKFYVGSRNKYKLPVPRLLFDVMPKRNDVRKIEPLGKLPLDDESIDSIVIDLPFLIIPPNAPSNKRKRIAGTNIIFNRFFGYYPADELYESYFHWISEAFRVLKPNGTCVFKCQSNISGGIQHNVEEWSFLCGQKVGFTMEDKFILQAKSRLISKPRMRHQIHARKYTSSFLVFKKFVKRKSKNFNYLDLLETCAERERERK